MRLSHHRLYYINIHGIRIFGTRLGKVKAVEMATIQPTASAEFHIARHYTSLVSEYRATLIGKPHRYFDTQTRQLASAIITETAIDLALQTRGSKFNTNAPTPHELIFEVREEAIKRAEVGKLTWLDCGFTISTFFSIEFPETVGETGTISMAHLKNDPSITLKRERRGGTAEDQVDFWVAYGAKRTPTNWLSAQIGYFKTAPEIGVLTAFPGLPVPDYPFQGQMIEERTYNKDYWDRHAFVA